MFRIPAASFPAALFAVMLISAVAIQATAADPDFKLQESPRTPPPQIIFANLPQANYSPTVLPDLYLPSPRTSLAPTATIPRSGVALDSTATSRISSINSGLGATSAPATSFDLGFSSFASISTSATGQSAIQGSSLSDKLLVTPPSLRDAGLGLGASQFVPPTRYLDDGHQFLNR
jgi:hypothetical protein